MHEKYISAYTDINHNYTNHISNKTTNHCSPSQTHQYLVLSLSPSSEATLIFPGSCLSPLASVPVSTSATFNTKLFTLAPPLSTTGPHVILI